MRSSSFFSSGLSFCCAKESIGEMARRRRRKMRFIGSKFRGLDKV
jgi:hypothetical protein